jgi:activator of HSP90 ATPase
MSNSIHQEIVIKANSRKVYDALTITKQFSELTEAAAEIDSIPGGKFSCFGGMITGQTIEITSCKTIVLAWRVGNWEPSIYSIVKIEFEKTGENETKLILDHTGFPEEHREHLEQGWYDRYWEPLKKYLNA